DDVFVAHVDRQLAPAVETPGREVDRANHSGDTVREKHLGVKLQVFELVDLDPDIIHDAKAADALHEFLFLEGMERASHDVHFDAALRRSDQPLDDHRILEALVLDEEPMPRLVDESADVIAPGSGTPDQIAFG